MKNKFYEIIIEKLKQDLEFHKDKQAEHQKEFKETNSKTQKRKALRHMGIHQYIKNFLEDLK